jgi:hypothetical protein
MSPARKPPLANSPNTIVRIAKRPCSARLTTSSDAAAK